MPMKANEIKQLILHYLPDADIRIEDLAGDNDHYAAYICSSQFKGKTRVQQHQMVYKALEGKIGTHLHALSIHTSVPKGENN